MTRILMPVWMTCLLACSLAFAMAARADNASSGGGGYSATVPVANTGDAARDAALSSALSQLLMQVAPSVKPDAGTLAQAPGFVRTYKYRRAATGGGLELQVDFDPGSIQHLVKGMGGSVASSGASDDNGGSGSDGTEQSTSTQGGSGTLWVGGINDAQDFASLLATLRQSSKLHNVTPVGAQNDGVLLQLDYDAPLADISTDLIAGGHLHATDAHHGADASLRWVQ